MKLKIGQKSPNFSLSDQNNKTHKLSNYKNKWVLLYFYPKDSTPGCTKEACTIAEAYPKFKKLNSTVFGISADKIESHKKFATKHKLPFVLLADVDRIATKAYGVWTKKKMMGHEYMGIVRTSFLIDPKGKIVKIYEKVKPAIHADEVLKDLKELTK